MQAYYAGTLKKANARENAAVQVEQAPHDGKYEEVKGEENLYFLLKTKRNGA